MNDCFPQVLMVMVITLTAHLIFALAEFALLNFLDMKGKEIFSEMPSQTTVILITSIIRMFAEFVVLSPITVGTAWWLLHCVRGENTNVGFILICFSNMKIYFRSVILRMLVWTIKLLIAIPLVLCAYIEYALITAFADESYRGGTYIALIICCTLIFICIGLIYIWVVTDFSLVNFIFTMNPDDKMINIIKKSINAMKRQKTKLIKLVCSFLGWIFTIPFVFPLFFAVPYASLSYATVIDEIIEKEIRKNTDDMFNKKTIARK